jgi:gluconolactonase
LVKSLQAAPVAVALALVSACSPSQGFQPGWAWRATETPTLQRFDPALEAIVPKREHLEQVAGDLGRTGGALWRAGRLWFSSPSDGRLRSLRPDGTPPAALAISDQVSDPAPLGEASGGGLAIDRDGAILFAGCGARTITRLEPDGRKTALPARGSGANLLRSPNGLVVAPDGALWFSDAPCGPMSGIEAESQVPSRGAIYRYDHGQLVGAILDLTRPAGLAFSPDGRTLYVSNSGRDMYVGAYDVSSNGSVSNGRRFISFVGAYQPDAPGDLAVDAAGDLWVAGPDGVRILTSDGRLLGHVRTHDGAPVRLAWGDVDNKSMFFITSSGVYRLKTAVAGLGSSGPRAADRRMRLDASGRSRAPET